MPISEAQKRANKKWDNNNKERKSYINKKSIAKAFINIASLEDLEILQSLVNVKLQEFNQSKKIWKKFWIRFKKTWNFPPKPLTAGKQPNIKLYFERICL